MKRASKEWEILGLQVCFYRVLKARNCKSFEFTPLRIEFSAENHISTGIMDEKTIFHEKLVDWLRLFGDWASRGVGSSNSCILTMPLLVDQC
jgi:hypothetical protein